MTTTPTRTAGRHKRRLALVTTLALATSLAPGVTPASAYLTAEQLQSDNTLSTAHLTVDGLTATRDKTGVTTISWRDATTQPWAKVNGVNGVRYTATSKTAGGCNVTNTPETSIIGQWPAGADCTISYTYAGWTATATVTTPSATIGVGTKPVGVAASPDGTTIYIANSESAYVSALDAATFLVSAIDTPGATGLYGVATSSESLICAVGSSSTGGYVANIDGTRKKVSWQKKTAGEMRGVAYSKARNAFYASMGEYGSLPYRSYSSIQEIYPTEIYRVFSGPDETMGIATSSDGSLLYFTDEDDNSLKVAELGTYSYSGWVNVGKNPTGVAISNTHAYVVNSGDNTISVIDLRARRLTGKPIAVGESPQAVAVSGQGETVYVANAGSNTVSVIDTATNTVISTTTVGKTPSGIDISPDGGTIYVTNKDDNTVSIIPTGRTETSTTG